MTRGNQRDTDRARAQARQAKHTQSGSQGNPLAKREADAKALQDKIARKEQLKAEGGDVSVSAAKGKGNKQKPQLQQQQQKKEEVEVSSAAGLKELVSGGGDVEHTDDNRGETLGGP